MNSLTLTGGSQQTFAPFLDPSNQKKNGLRRLFECTTIKVPPHYFFIRTIIEIYHTKNKSPSFLFSYPSLLLTLNTWMALFIISFFFFFPKMLSKTFKLPKRFSSVRLLPSPKKNLFFPLDFILFFLFCFLTFVPSSIEEKETTEREIESFNF